MEQNLDILVQTSHKTEDEEIALAVPLSPEGHQAFNIVP